MLLGTCITLLTVAGPSAFANDKSPTQALCTGKAIPSNPEQSINVGSGVRSVDFNHDDTTLAWALWNGDIKLWDVSTKKELDTKFEGYRDYVSSVAFSPDGESILMGERHGNFTLLDAVSGEEKLALKGHGDNNVISVAFGPDGTNFVTGSGDETIKVWSVEKDIEPIIFKGHESWVMSVAFSPDGTKIVSGSDDKTIKLWDVNKGNVMPPISQAAIKGEFGC